MGDSGSTAEPAPAPAAWRLRLHGPAQLLAPDGAAWALDRLTALIAARLALAGPQPRALMARQLWPDANEARARGNLRQRLLRLKSQAGWAWIDGGVQLRLHPRVQLDRTATGLLLEGLPAPGDEELANWLQALRSAEQREQARAWQLQLSRFEAAQQWDEAIAAAEQLVALDPGAEASRRTLARLHYLNHDLGRASAELEQLRLMLQREYGAAPSAASEQLRLLVMGAAPAPAPAPAVAWQLSPALQRPPVLVGHDAELAQVHKVLTARGALLLLGEAGLGKSRLLAEAVAGRADVLAVKAQANDTGVPYATLARLLRRQLAQAGHPARTPAATQLLARLVPELRSEAPVPTPTVEMSPGLLLEAVAAQLKAGGQRVIVVDDLHFADAASLEMLAALVLAEPLSGIAWMFAQRPGQGGDATRAFGAALSEGARLVPIRLAPLDQDAVARLLHSLGLPGLDVPAWAARLQSHTGGNPLFILETLKQLEPGDLAAGRMPRSASVGALIDRRLQALSVDALALARLAAIAGEDFGLPLAEQVTGRRALQLADAWSELQAAQVLRERAFAHDLVLEATLRAIPQPVAEHLHGAVALWLQARDGEPARIAGHWRAAARPDLAIPWLMRAADQAHLQLRPVEEAAFLELLVDQTKRDNRPLAVRTLLRLARVVIEAQGLGAPAAPLQRALELASDDAERARVLNQLAEMEFNRMQPQASARAAEQAAAMADAVADPLARAEAVLRWHRALCAQGQAAREEALWQSHQHWMTAVRLDNAELVSDRGWVLDRLGRAREARAWHERALQQARATGRPVNEAVVLGNLAQSRWLSGEPAAAIAALDAAATLSGRHVGLHPASDYLAAYRGMVAAELGHFSAALTHFERAMADTVDQSPQARLALAARRTLLWVAIGQHSRARADATAVLADATLPAWALATAHHALAQSSRSPGRAQAQGLQRAELALGDDAQIALLAPIRLKRQLLVVRADPTAAPGALIDARNALRQAKHAGNAGLRWAGHWVAAQLAVEAGRPLAARRHARACSQRPPGVVPLHISDGVWWHGLWRSWQRLGDETQAQLARAEGLAWIRRTLQQHLAVEFHAGFRSAVLAHRELLAG